MSIPSAVFSVTRTPNEMVRGLGIGFRVYERGEYGQETAKYLIFGIQEGQPVSMEELARSLRYVQSLKKRLVLAVINRRGEVVYYSLSQLTLE